MRSIGTMRMSPPSGFASRCPRSFSISCPTVFTSALCSVKRPADMPRIQSMSNSAIVSIRCRNSRSVPDRISRFRRSSARTACASLASGSRIFSISRELT